jgi:hypothetical protein
MFQACSRSGGVWQHYRIAALHEAINRNMSIALHFDDESCEKQKASLELAISDAKFKKMGAYRVQMKSEKALEKELKITAACTVVVFKGAEEMGRAVGESDPQRLRLLLAQSL